MREAIASRRSTRPGTLRSAEYGGRSARVDISDAISAAPERALSALEGAERTLAEAITKAVTDSKPNDRATP